MLATLVSQGLLQGWDKCIVASCETACSYDMHIVVNRLSSDLFGGHEKTANIDIEAEICEATGNNFRTSIVTILSHLCNEDSWITAFLLRKCLHILQSLLVLSLALIVSLLKGLFAVGTANDRVLGDVSAEDFLECIADLSDCGSVLSRLDREGKQISLTGLSR